MAHAQSDRTATNLVQTADDEFVELTELDFEELPPTDPVGFEPPTRPRTDSPSPDESVARRPPLPRRLSAPPCVRFADDPKKDDPNKDEEEPPSTQRSSLAPLSAAAPPVGSNVPAANAHRIRPPWRWLIAAASVAAALGVLAFRAAETPPSTPALLAGALPAAHPVPVYTPEDFPVAGGEAVESTDDGMVYEWLDLTEMPREERPAPRAEDRNASSARVPAEPHEPAVAAASVEETLPADDGADTHEPIAEPAEDAAVPVHTFDPTEAAGALSGLAGAARACRGPGEPAGSATLAVTFAPSGRVTTARLEAGPFVGTPVGGCIAKVFRSARVTPFEGSLTTVHKTLVLR